MGRDPILAHDHLDRLLIHEGPWLNPSSASSLYFMLLLGKISHHHFMTLSFRTVQFQASAFCHSSLVLIAITF